VITVEPGLYYPDGQIRDEVFVYGSFAMSRMGHAGVTCMDCHDPHTLETIEPPTSNALCMRCHTPGLMNAPVIEPTSHSHHLADSAGNRCVSCHMPKTTYMQRDPRADHGFHSPDPLMTRELGVPNACADCHESEGLDWQIQHAEAWYGPKLAESRQRRRAQAVASAYESDPAVAPELIALAESEDIDAWRAAYVGLMGQHSASPEVAAYLTEATNDPSALVRSRAVATLPPFRDSLPVVFESLGDQKRGVRFEAANWLFNQGVPIPDGPGLEAFKEYLETNADRPNTLFQMAMLSLREGQMERIPTFVERAVGLDRANPNLHRQAAVFYSMTGDLVQAEKAAREAGRLAPPDALHPYTIGLLRAERGDYEGTVEQLEKEVALDREFYRAWFNLGLSYLKMDEFEKARNALLRAAPEYRNNPEWRQAMRTVGASGK